MVLVKMSKMYKEISKSHKKNKLIKSIKKKQRNHKFTRVLQQKNMANDEKIKYLNNEIN